MGSALALAGSALALFVAGSTWLAFFPPVPADLDGAENLDSRARRLAIPLADGDSLQGWLVPGENPATIIVFHGYGRDHHRAWRYGGFLNDGGYSVLACDFRSSRIRDRRPTTLGGYEVAEARAVVDWAVATLAAGGRPLGLLGESLGGSLALVVAAERPEVEAVVVDAPFSTGLRALEDTFARWLRLPAQPFTALARDAGRALTGHDPAALDARPAAARLAGRNVFFIHGADDRRLGPENTRELWRAAGGHHPLWWVEGAGHNEGWQRQREEYERRVLAFLDRALLDRGPGVPAGEW